MDERINQLHANNTHQNLTIMKNYNTLIKLVKRMAFAVLLGMLVYGCNSSPKEPQLEMAPEPEVSIDDPNQEIVYGPEDEVLKDIPAVKGEPMEGEEVGSTPEKSSPKLDAEEYDAIIEVTEEIKLGTSGTLNVWVGKEKYMPKQNQNTVRDTTSWYSYAGVYARITPVAKNFVVEPDAPTVVKLDETGSGVQYTITPQEMGKFEVSALIELFDNEECIGTPVIKPAQVLSVKVDVAYGTEIWKPVWTNFKRFWVAFVALFFGALFFVIRKFVKKKTGYTEKKNVLVPTEEENVKETED